MGKLIEYFLHYPMVPVSIIVGVFALFAYLTNRESWDFWFMNALYGLPFVGRLEQLARERSVRNAETGLLKSEERLCREYAQHIKFLSRADFDSRMEYLRKAEDDGRRPLPIWFLGVLVVLVSAEGYGFSYLLAAYFGDNLSEFARQAVTFALVIVLCIILVIATHFAGHLLHKIGVISRCERIWDNAGRPGGNPISENIGLNQNQAVDDSEAPYRQCLNRVGTHKGWTPVVGIIAAILALGVFQVGIRMEIAHRTTIEETTGQTAAPPGLPDYLAAAQKVPDEKARLEHAKAAETEWIFGALTLTTIYLLTQGVGLIAGSWYGFAGRGSAAAYRETRGAAVYEVYRDRVDSWIAIADARLSSLQQRIQRRGDTSPTHKTFHDFLKADRARKHELDQETHAAPPTGPKTDDIATLLQQVRSIDTESAKALIRTLPEDKRRAVQEALRKDKEARAASASALDADLDDILSP